MGSDRAGKVVTVRSSVGEREALIEKIPISVFILTKNEQDNLPGCLASVAWSDDIHVFDSHSTDRTVEIAEAAGAKVSYRVFDSFSQHQNWALENLPFEYPWIFYLDADERATPELVASMAKAVADPRGNVSFNVERRDFFMSRWLKHVQPTSQYQRLFIASKMRYERLGHCVSKPDGPVGAISGYLDHYPFSKGLADWLSRHNFYSTQEAQQIKADRENGVAVSFRELFLGKSVSEKRRQLKLLFYRMPFRPLVKFTWLYLFKGGFLDGLPGYTYARLIAMYEQMIILKTRELTRAS